MTVGARLRSKAASSLGRRGPLGRSRRASDEETDAIVEHLEGDDEDPASQDGTRDGGGRRAGPSGARRVHLAALPERYEPLEEPAPGDKPRKKCRRKLKKYGKNFGKAISKGCRYIVIGLQGFAAAYSAPFGVATSVVCGKMETWKTMAEKSHFPETVARKLRENTGHRIPGPYVLLSNISSNTIKLDPLWMSPTNVSVLRSHHFPPLNISALGAGDNKHETLANAEARMGYSGLISIFSEAPDAFRDLEEESFLSCVHFFF